MEITKKKNIQRWQNIFVSLKGIIHIYRNQTSNVPYEHHWTGESNTHDQQSHILQK